MSGSPPHGAAADVDGGADEEARVAAAVAARLARLCPQWSEADFQALVLDVARTKLRWAREERALQVKTLPASALLARTGATATDSGDETSQH